MIYNDKGPALDGINLADGELRWQVRLDEAAERLCSTDDPATVLVVRSDKQAHLLSLADGGLRPAAATSSCRQLPCDPPFDFRASRLEHNEEERWQTALPGMDVEEVLRESGITLVLGYKTPGSAVPMIARVEPPSPAPLHAVKAGSGDFAGGHGQSGAPKVLWKTLVPAQNPLEYRPRNPRSNEIGVGFKSLAVAYESNNRENNRLTLFSLADGKRRFDVKLPKIQRGISSVLLTPRLVIVSSNYGMIAAFDVKSGEEVYTID